MTAHNLTPLGRVKLHSDLDPASGCWNWTGSVHAHGYGRVVYRYREWPAHRFAYTHLVGPIPDGLDLDHLCHNRRCVNPDHLEPVTKVENQLRARKIGYHETSPKTCKRGHPISERLPSGRCKPCRKITTARGC